MRKVFVDRSLTPENAKERGLEWQQDSIYDPEAPEIANKMMENSVSRGEFFLGSPATPGGEINNIVGVYRKIRPDQGSDRA